MSEATVVDVDTGMGEVIVADVDCGNILPRDVDSGILEGGHGCGVNCLRCE